MPTGSYLSLVQGVVVLSHTSHKKEADEFLQYVKTKPMSEIFRKYGFSLPEEAR
jgi:ABC-type molybdate transport system substrate-binding protein